MWIIIIASLKNEAFEKKSWVLCLLEQGIGDKFDDQVSAHTH